MRIKIKAMRFNASTYYIKNSVCVCVHTKSSLGWRSSFQSNRILRDNFNWNREFFFFCFVFVFQRAFNFSLLFSSFERSRWAPISLVNMHQTDIRVYCAITTSFNIVNFDCACVYSRQTNWEFPLYIANSELRWGVQSSVISVCMHI